MKKFALLILFSACVVEQSKIQLLEKIEFKALMDQDVQLIDVRTSKEYIEGYIKEAQNIDFNSADFLNQISKLDKDTPVLVYCALGSRSAKASKVLDYHGFKKIYDLKGGYFSW